MTDFLDGNHDFSNPDDDHTLIIPTENLNPLPDEAIDFSDKTPHGNFNFNDLRIANKSDLTKAAAPLLAFMARLKHVANKPNLEQLKANLISELYKYVAQLRRVGIDPTTVQTAHYILCASLDDVVRCMPWFVEEKRTQVLSLSAEFHHDVQSGSRFFLLLKKLSTTPANSLSLLELMYYCMSLGMKGYYRSSHNGSVEFEHAREELYFLIIRYQNKDRNTLSPHWESPATPYKPLKFEMPIWLAGIIILVLVGFSYIACSLILRNNSEMLMNSAAHIPPERMPTWNQAAPAPDNDTVNLRQKLTEALSDEIQLGEISIKGSEMVPIIRLNTRQMFHTGDIEISPKYKKFLETIGNEINKNNATRVNVIGYTDAAHIHTQQYPSNYDLSVARAQAATQILQPYLPNTPIITIGRGDQNPIADNKTEEGRQLNRRIEIVVKGTINP